MSRFEEAVRSDFAASSHHPQYPVWLDYALRANERGGALMEAVVRPGSSLSGVRHLDIGCGYGGACVAAARLGALSVGIDLDARLLSFARANAEDNPELPLQFLRCDVMQAAHLASLGTFDLITCDNVIEHVAVPEVLVARFRQLLRPGGTVYVTIPNAFSVGQIASDCHYGQFGITLLDPEDAAAFMGEVSGHAHYDVSDYYRLESYRAMFERQGLRAHVEDDEGAGLEDGIGLVRSLRRRAEQAPIPARFRAKIERRVNAWVARFEADLAAAEVSAGFRRHVLRRALQRDYLCELWRVRAIREHDGAARGMLRRLTRRWPIA